MVPTTNHQPLTAILLMLSQDLLLNRDTLRNQDTSHNPVTQHSQDTQPNLDTLSSLLFANQLGDTILLSHLRKL